MTIQSVILASTLHDPQGKFIEHIENLGDKLTEMYSNSYAVVTDTTSPKTKKALKDTNWNIIHQTDGEGLDKISEARRQCLKIGTDSRLHAHVIDFDRVIYWVKQYPIELGKIIEEIPNHDFLVLGRTEQAMRTHPEAQIETERIANRVCSILINKEMDFLAGSRGVSPRIAELILEHSDAEFCDTDGEWPIIVDLLSDAHISFIEVNGLGFETSMRKQDMKVDEEVVSWKEYVDSNPVYWLHRVDMAHRIVKTAISKYQRLNESFGEREI